MNKDELFLDYRNLLFSIAYDMLGSVAEAEDMVQDAYEKWIAASEPLSYPKAYLVKIITNHCINYLELARKKREKYVGVWLPEPMIQRPDNKSPVGEIYHALSIGLMVLLEKLTPIERAVFLLKEIFSYDHREIGEIIGKTEDNCRQLLTRAKKQLGNDHKRFQIDLQAHEAILVRFIDACQHGDIESLITMLKEDITLYADGGGSSFEANKKRITAIDHPLHGADNVAKFLIAITGKFLTMAPEPNHNIIMVNGLPALVNYSGDRPINIICLEISDIRTLKRSSMHKKPKRVDHSIINSSAPTPFIYYFFAGSGMVYLNKVGE